MENIANTGSGGSLKAVILDWAGTTIDFGSFAPTSVILEVFERRGLAITPEQARAPMGLPKKDHLRAVLQMPAVAAAWQEKFGSPFGPADLEEMYADFVPLQMDCLREYATLIPGTLETVDALRRQGLRIGSTTGYTDEMMAILAKEAIRQGYEPDCIVVPSQVPAGRPAPYMCWLAATKMQVYPAAAVVKVGDTQADIQEGLNAGMWTVAVAMTGNELGLRESELAALPPDDVELRRVRARQRLEDAGAHFVIDGIADLPATLETIREMLASGERP